MQSKTYCGYATIVGKPNVGKSTLLNKILGKKITITSSKAQTTRYKIFGIKTKENIQTIYIDTPGTRNRQKKNSNKKSKISTRKNSEIVQNHRATKNYFCLSVQTTSSKD